MQEMSCLYSDPEPSWGPAHATPDPYRGLSRSSKIPNPKAADLSFVLDLEVLEGLVPFGA